MVRFISAGLKSWRLEALRNSMLTGSLVSLWLTMMPPGSEMALAGGLVEHDEHENVGFGVVFNFHGVPPASSG